LKRQKILFLLIFISPFSFSQDKGTDYWVQLSPEIRLNTGKFEFRVRPYESFFLTNTDTKKMVTSGRTDFMAGYLYKKFKFFVYAKFDTNKKGFIGPRIDFNTRIFNNRVALHGQYRYFWGLNKISKDHQYLVTMIEYDTNKFLNPGILGLNKHNFKGSMSLFHGPSISFKINKTVSFLGSYMKDLNTRSRYFSFIRFNFKVLNN
jgi:hypothetical protein